MKTTRGEKVSFALIAIALLLGATMILPGNQESFGYVGGGFAISGLIVMLADLI